MASQLLVHFLFVFAVAIATVKCNVEVDALSALKSALVDPQGALQSWDPNLVDPCTWFHVTCNDDNKVTRLDLGAYGLQGSLVPQLGSLANLQYLEIYRNQISGSIPAELGNLANLLSLDLYENQLSGPIPDSLGNLKALVFMRLNDNKLTGTVPASVKALTNGNLRILTSVSLHRLNKGYVETSIKQEAGSQK
ncbi:hypothetical protein Pint_23786 [Pistacia integerrima]|uniref:Uncharacterized protein n=1 Tax=Pistacia integerrima TaxID=434235 RepID=A0ACC0YJI4_9ROSI|nr:hypothetical protein Pint_23786 [Pistacia integerrima]